MTPSQATRDLDTAINLQAEVETIIRDACATPSAEAARIAPPIVDGLRRRMGGNTLHIPVGLTRDERAHRDAHILNQYNGRNRPELCKKYGISKSRFYQIIGDKA